MQDLKHPVSTLTATPSVSQIITNLNARSETLIVWFSQILAKSVRLSQILMQDLKLWNIINKSALIKSQIITNLNARSETVAHLDAKDNVYPSDYHKS